MCNLIFAICNLIFLTIIFINDFKTSGGNQFIKELSVPFKILESLTLTEVLECPTPLSFGEGFACEVGA